MKTTTKLWLGIGILILLSPLGLILPERFQAGDAWGEWGRGGLWNAPLPDYAFKGWEAKGLSHLSLAYVFCAILGIAVTALMMLLVGRFLVKKR